MSVQFVPIAGSELMDTGKNSDLKKGLELGGLRGVPAPAQSLWKGVQEQHHKPAECHLWCVVQICLHTPQQHSFASILLHSLQEHAGLQLKVHLFASCDCYLAACSFRHCTTVCIVMLQIQPATTHAMQLPCYKYLSANANICFQKLICNARQQQTPSKGSASSSMLTFT